MDLKFAIQIFLALLFVVAGVSHFRNPGFFLKITPPWVPVPATVNKVVGVVEVALGIALTIPALRQYAAWGIIALLLVVFPANVYHFQKSLKKKKHVIPTLVRLPFQALFIYLAYLLT